MTRKVTRRADRGVDRAREVYERHGRVFRVVWVAVGVVVVLAGLAMIVFPGPVTVVVPTGLVMLSVVFGWARRALLVSVEKGAQAKERMEATSTWVKILGAVALLCLAAAVLALVLLW
jgi:hypothetical protein